MVFTALLGVLAIGFLVGAVAAWLVARSRSQAERQAAQQVREGLTEAFKAAAADALRGNNESFLHLARTQLAERERAIEHLVAPLKDSLERVDGQFRTLDQARSALVEQLRTLAEGQQHLRRETGNLATALRAPHVRGRWGEVQLRRVVEATGMLEHCDFVLQATTRDNEGALLRPDLVVRLPGGKQVVVDAKVPLTAYLDAWEADDEAVRAGKLAEHARQVRDHVAKLSAKAYWRQFEPAPDFVVMFLPDEAFLRAAQEQDSSIGEYAWGSNVIPASPTNLFALLRTIAAIWQQETIAQSAREVHALGQELYERIATLGGHFAAVGRSLGSAVEHYNRTVGSLESRVLVTGRKLAEHGVTGELEPIDSVEAQPRPVSAPELVGAEQAPRALDAA
ncbi:MAG: DNA recombination protein RmuC [Thermoleophilia bacterium]|nr:DNA recombination protein RmuC [Thermoleophilia bacterium]